MLTEKIKNKMNQIFAKQIKARNIRLSAMEVKNGRYPDIRNTDETINYLLSHQCSMSRLGDGEFINIFGGSLNYQPYNKNLAKKLIEILHSNVPGHIVCVSDAFGDMNERNEENKAYWREHLKVWRHQYYRYIDMNKTYYNTSATRVYKLLEDKTLAGPRFEKWKKIWDGRDIVFIEGTQTRMGVGNDLFSNAKSIRRILGPAENAFIKWEELYSEAIKLDKNVLFILALGPAATVISYELAKAGFQALDMGHIDVEYEWFLRNSSVVAIDGKYTNEVKGGNRVEACNDAEYLKQIIYTVK